MNGGTDRNRRALRGLRVAAVSVVVVACPPPEMQPPSVSPTRQLERQLAAEDDWRRSRPFDSPSEPSRSPASKSVRASRHRQSLDELATVEFSTFADTTGRLSMPVPMHDVEISTGTNEPSTPTTTQSDDPVRRPSARAVPARTKRTKRSKLYERSSSDPGSILHGSSLSELGTLSTRLRRPKRLDPYHDPIPRTASSADPRAVSPSRRLGLCGKPRSQPRPATLSSKRYGSHYSEVGASGGSWGRQLEAAAHSGSVASDRPRVVARGNMTVCLTRPSAQSPLRRSASEPITSIRIGRAATPPTGPIDDLKQMLECATWADERPSSLEWHSAPELGEPGLPHLRRALKTASGFVSKRYILARASIA